MGDDDAAKSTRLLRFVGFLIMWPAFSTGFVLLLFAGKDHYLHTGMFMGIGLGGLALTLLAPRIARRGGDGPGT
jgi:hypothetical protein